jgi:CheY-like chemotaxis protein
VEDDGAVGDALGLLLATEGFTVHRAGNGQEALDRLRSGGPPDLILLDLMMPVMDGWEFRRRQRQDPALASIPVIILSTTATTAARVNGLGDVGYLQKPVGADELLAAVRRFARPRKPCLLVVEDDEPVRTMLGVGLRHFGFAVLTAANGQQAVELYLAQRANIDLVLMDVQMPGLDGPQTLAQLRQLNPQVRCCFMSGYTGKYSDEELERLAGTAVLHKPFRLADVQPLLWRLAQAP